MKLDAIDLRILDAVQRDGRITKLRLAEQVGLSPTPCWVRLHRMEQAGLIEGYHARLDPRRVAPVASVIIEVTLANHRQADFERFEKAIAGRPEITSFWSVGGGVDYFLMAKTRDIDAYQRMIDQMLADDIGIDRYFTYIVTRTLKESSRIPVELLAPI
ncbi:Lrp/AsnC family transcriptional regulator [Pikeienuella sp. HZG-20]|uniref:Lrp/AsnC family transcriptional regulator n=1 Tax=Paludibacillus litoralis TaxID=3133267 RepID=UPI0030EC34B0